MGSGTARIAARVARSKRTPRLDGAEWRRRLHRRLFAARGVDLAIAVKKKVMGWAALWPGCGRARLRL
eukprot:11217338-Lingulodinium_polyedra.AAC.1